MVTFDLQLFGGGKGGSSVHYTQAQVPQATPEERELQAQQVAWAKKTQPSAELLLNMGSNALKEQQVNPNPNWQGLYNAAQKATGENVNLVNSLTPQVQQAASGVGKNNGVLGSMMGQAVNTMAQGNKELEGRYNSAITDNTGRMGSLLQGQLPSQYADARRQALQSDLNSTVGNTLSGLASRGIINSSQADRAFNGISRNASDTLARNYTGDMNTAAGLAGQAFNSELSGINGIAGLRGDTYRNQMQGYGQQADLNQNNFANQLQGVSTLSQLANQRQQFAMSPIETAATAQEASINVPMKYFAMATGQNAPTSELLRQMSSQRYSVATPAQAVVEQGGGGFFGGLMSGLGGFFCFVADTDIATTTGAKKIIEVKPGDVVITVAGVNTVKALHETGTQPIVRICTPHCEVDTTAGERVMTIVGMKRIEEVSVDDCIMTVHGYEPVKSIIDTGRREQTYELEVSGDGCFYANGILAEGFTAEEVRRLKEIVGTEEVTEEKTTVTRRRRKKVAE